MDGFKMNTNQLEQMKSGEHALPQSNPGLGKRLRSRRKELGLTQAQLAKQVGTSQAVVQKIENGKSLRPRILADLAMALDVQQAWLMYGIADLGELSEDAIELGRAWAKLQEPHRSAMKDAILRIGQRVQ